MFATISEIKPFLESGQLTALGVSSLDVDPLLPSVNPISQVVPGFDVVGFMGLFAPADIPADIADRLSEDVGVILSSPDTIETFADLGMRARPSSPLELSDRVKTDSALWKKTISENNITTR